MEFFLGRNYTVSKSYLDSKSILFEIINNFRLYDRVCIGVLLEQG